ncbi:unnamed protein product, partial [Didymodactylos carnosus]
PNEDEALAKLTKNLKNEMNNDGKVPDAVLVYCKTPSHIIGYTGASIRLFGDLCSSSNSVTSWDATGGIIKRKNGRKLLRYELTMT